MIRVVDADGDTIESIGLRLTRQVLAREDDAMIDLRAQRAVGIDAVDELREFYAVKVYGGAEPDEVHLTDGEVQRALDSPHFFLVVVSGIEDRSVERRVKVITRPLECLHRLNDCGTVLSGVRLADGLAYPLVRTGQ